MWLSEQSEFNQEPENFHEFDWNVSDPLRELTVDAFWCIFQLLLLLFSQCDKFKIMQYFYLMRTFLFEFPTNNHKTCGTAHVSLPRCSRLKILQVAGLFFFFLFFKCQLKVQVPHSVNQKIIIQTFFLGFLSGSWQVDHLIKSMVPTSKCTQPR